MKFILAIFLTLAAQYTNISQAKSEIENLFTPQNSANIPNYFNENINFDIPTAKGTYNANQAKIVFEKFLREYAIEGYLKKHSGGGNGKSKFEIGTILLNEIPHRTYVLYNEDSPTIKILELRIEKE